MQGEKMIDQNNPQFVQSVLNVKATANCEVSEAELHLPEGKSIAELIYEEKEKSNQTQDPEKEANS
jgi:hypothetical protein